MDKKKMAAAMAAVYTYIRTGEEAAAAAAQAPQEPAAQPSPPSGTVQMNVWGLSGRQAIMNAANMMQLRMFK
ncbi:MAG: hypothetical protein MI892_16380 [Desulfobacterales bacterium]|nr:hypothetical protein [Desulfobacterales bacterium]